MHQKLEPTILTIFGATGSLSRERLLPALYHLQEHKLLPKEFLVMGFARSEFSHQQFRKFTKPAGITGKDWQKFAGRIFYHSGNFSNSEDFQKLAGQLAALEARNHSCANRLFYFSTLPSHYETISHQLDRAGLLVGCAIHKRQTRVVIEKPFGADLRSAKKLDQVLNKYFTEDQIYRIDHYLGKETVQNLLTVRFANSIFEPIWNHNYIDHVQISSLQDIGIGKRGAFYEQTGAIRDTLQNHLMQLLALTAMEPPHDLSAAAIRDERAKVINSLRPPRSAALRNSIVTGQYAGYTREPNVARRSRVETYAAAKIFVDNNRWAGVPFYLRTGKKVKTRVTEISLHFKPAAQYLFRESKMLPNVLVFRIQPDEGLFLNLMAKYPGFGIRLHPVTMELGYHAAFREEMPEAYERLLLDFMEGDQRLFARSDEIEYSWRYVDELEKYLARAKKHPQLYRPDTWGPKAADTLIREDRRDWQIV